MIHPFHIRRLAVGIRLRLDTDTAQALWTQKDHLNNLTKIIKTKEMILYNVIQHNLSVLKPMIKVTQNYSLMQA